MSAISRRLFLRGAVVVAAGIAAALAGCAPKVVQEAEPTKPPEPKEEQVAKEEEAPTPTAAVAGATPQIFESAAGKGGIVLNYWNYLVGDDGLTMVKMVDQFCEENPDVTIKMQRIPGDTLREKIMPALVAGTAPELYFGLSAPSADIIMWAKQGLFLVLDDLFDSGTLPRDDFTEGALDKATVDGHVQVLPIGGTPYSLWCNVQVFEEAGVEFGPLDRPMTRDEFLEKAIALTRDSKGRHPGDSGFDPEDIQVWAYGGLSTQYNVARQNGCDRVTLDGSCKPMLLEEGWIDSIEWEKDLLHKYYVKANQHWSADEHALISNKLAMHSIGSWHYNFWNTTHPELKHGVLLWPTIGKERGTTLGLHSVNSFEQVKGEKREWALKWITWVSNSHLWASDAGIPPTRKSIAERPEVKNNWALPIQVEAMKYPYYPNVSYPCPSEVNGVVDPMVQQALQLEKEPLEAMQEVLPRVEQILERCCKEEWPVVG